MLWAGGGSNGTRLSNWLDPLNLNPQPQYLDGIGCRVNLIDRTITTSEVIPSACDIRLKDVRVQGGATLTLNAVGNVNINGLIVRTGSTLIIDAQGEVFIEPGGLDVEPGAELDIR